MNNETIKPTIPEGWTEWAYNYDNPHPENPNTFVNLLFRDGATIGVAAGKVRWRIDEKDEFDRWRQIQDSEDIIAYKVAEEN